MANESITFDFASRGAASLQSDFRKTSDASVLAAKGARILADSLEKQRRAADTSAGATLALAKADKILADAEDEAIAKYAEERVAADKAAAAKIRDAEAAKRDAEEAKRAAASHDRLVSSLKKAGSFTGAALGAGGLLAAGSSALAIASPLGAAGAALGAFGAVAIPVLTKVTTAQQALKKAQEAYSLATTKAQRVTALKDEQKATDGLTASEKGLLGPLGQLEKLWGRVESQLAPVVVDVVKVGLAFAKSLLPAFKSLASVGGFALETILGYLGQLVRSPFFRQITKQISDLASQAAPLLGQALQSLLKVFLRLFVQVGPAGIKLLQALLPAIVEITKDLTPAIVAFADLTAAVVTYLAKNHLLIPALAALGVALALALDTNPVGAFLLAVSSLIVGITYLSKHWNQVWSGIKAVASTAWHWLYDNVFAKLITFFTKTIPAVFDIFKETVRIAWDDIKITFLKGVEAITGIMGKLPGPLGAPFRKAHADIAREVAGIQGDVAKAARNIQADWDRIHGKVVPVKWTLRLPPNLPGITSGGAPTRPGYAAGTPGAAPGWAWVGERGPELVRMRGGETVIPNHALPGYAGGTSGWNFTDSFSPTVGAFGRSISTFATAVTNAVVRAGDKLISRSLSQLAGPSAGYGGGVARWAPLVLQVLRLLGQPAGDLGTVLSQMQTESGGNPNAINLWDSNAAAGDPSRGLMQVIGSTFAAYAGPFRGLGIYNPLANIFAGLNYAIHRYGAAWTSVLGHGHGYDSGGFLPPGLSLAYNGTGRPEMVVPSRSGAAGGNITVHIHAPVGSNPRDIGKTLADYLKAYQRGGGKVLIG